MSVRADIIIEKRFCSLSMQYVFARESQESKFRKHCAIKYKYFCLLLFGLSALLKALNFGVILILNVEACNVVVFSIPLVLLFAIFMIIYFLIYSTRCPNYLFKLFTWNYFFSYVYSIQISLIIYFLDPKAVMTSQSNVITLFFFIMVTFISDVALFLANLFFPFTIHFAIVLIPRLTYSVLLFRKFFLADHIGLNIMLLCFLVISVITPILFKMVVLELIRKLYIKSKQLRFSFKYFSGLCSALNSSIISLKGNTPFFYNSS